MQKYYMNTCIYHNNNSSVVLPYIIDVLNDKVRPLVKVIQPESSEELGEVVQHLDEEHKINKM